MIYLDTTSASSWRHSSGLARVSGRLLEELDASARQASWPSLAKLPGKADWILIPELFSEHERPGFTEFLSQSPCRLAAVFHDAIPIRHPSITWPKSVERHPSYMKLLSRFDRIWAVSAASRDELLGFWKWQGVRASPQVDVLHLGADWKGVPRVTGESSADATQPRIVCTGILEPRKNQMLLLDAFEVLRLEGVQAELHLVGRVNPHFGAPILQRVEHLAARWPGLHYHAAMPDQELVELVRSARATAFPSIAEGCGLPLLESLWMGVPCICSDILPVQENAAGGGCHVVQGNSLAGWVDGLRKLLTSNVYRAQLSAAAMSRSLPTWARAAQMLRESLV
ncbi:MAG TPA: glycosyltransferase family 1 protein [Opitutaceae bacterium]|jgi:glycosyltransferase involved in cell wall biosynthesis|nr:glycosyltransferase family 1 protein [Opitutaceae bacterium]